MNKLFYGDNYEVLRRHVGDESVDLVYLDPPFNSNRNYNVLFEERTGLEAASQIQAFEDTWRWDQNAAASYQECMERGGTLAVAMKALRTLVGNSDMLAYLSMMGPRLAELRRVLKPTGSIYLHCDPTAAHYLKILMDSVFGPENFRSEITWQRTNVHNDAKRWAPVADIILYYGKSSTVTWNPVYLPHDEAYLKTKYRHLDANGRRYRLDNMTSPNPRPNMMYEWKGHSSPAMGWRYSQDTMAKLDAEGRIWYPASKDKRPQLKRYLDEMQGPVVGNVWTDIDPINSRATERMGYPTQKPLRLLDRIIEASSNPGDVVLDPFCGCGTAVVAAQQLKRQWIGIDITHLAIALLKHRLLESFGSKVEYSVTGEPVSVTDAAQLAGDDPYQFQWWALGLVGARPIDEKKGADQGIDGRLFFHDEGTSGDTKQIVFSVKAGQNVGVSAVRDLGHVVTREDAEIGVLISLIEPTKPMRAEAAGAGVYISPITGTAYPRLQVLTVGDLLEGRGIAYPAMTGGNVSFARRQTAKPSQPEKERLF